MRDPVLDGVGRWNTWLIEDEPPRAQALELHRRFYQTQDNRGASNARDLCTYQECVQTENSTAFKKCKGLCCCRPLQIPVGMMKSKPGNLVLYNISLVSSHYVVHVSNINTHSLDKNHTNIWLLSSVGDGTVGILPRVRRLCSRSNLQRNLHFQCF